MLNDIKPPQVEDIAVAVVKEEDDEWNVYLFNFKPVSIEGVLVSSKGYGEQQGEIVKTSMLRHFLDTIPPQSFQKIEPIPPILHGISNEYWVSFYVNKQMYDKKYVFLAETIIDDNLITIPLIQKPGVMIK